MKSTNIFLLAGILVIALSFLLRHYHVVLPDFWDGFLVGIGIALELIGMYFMRRKMPKSETSN